MPQTCNMIQKKDLEGMSEEDEWLGGNTTVREEGLGGNTTVREEGLGGNTTVREEEWPGGND